MIRLAERYPGKTGMTLIELVVVLALLAGLAAMALTGVADLGNRARYDETVTRMDLIRQAVVGDGSEAGRFIRDMGRLPDSLGELIAGTNNYSSMAFTFNVPSYPPIPATLCAGWAGPYLQGSGTNIYDGFGEALQLNGGTQLVAVVKDRTGWLTNHMVYSFAHATQCTLQVQVRALRANPQESVCIWHAACSNDSPFIDWIPGIEYFPNTLCQYEKQVYVCLVNNTNIAPPTSLGT
ncbi:MAG: prepilin-type N-terminal cleavage/methylation domain-containing protein, partial [Spartobacteria bacterium]|nr:prepilin-type N-terminal cleavage/methylation domain-containing protein [Spartobacteria bacterium]